MENEKLLENEIKTEAAEEEESKKSRIGLFLNKFFHFYDRGSSMKQEIIAGLSVFLISMCALFMNIQIVSQAFTEPSYTGLYFGATLISFLGTMAIGFFCNLPLVQVSSLGLSSVFISTIGANQGLTYQNLLAITFISAILYVVLVSVPFVKKFVYRALPQSVRKALPAAIGLYVVYISLSEIGIIQDLSLTSLGGMETFPKFCIIMGAVGILIALLFKKLKTKHPFISAFLITTVLFYTFGALNQELRNSLFHQNRIWIGFNPDSMGEMYTINLGFAGMDFGSVFKSGFDFSAFTAAGGSVFAIFTQGILMFLFMGMYESEGSMAGAELNGGFLQPGTEEKMTGRVLMVSAATNVLAPLFGSAPVSVGKQSAVSTGDGGKTGLSAVVCGLGYFLLLFTWLTFAIFANFTAVVPEYGHAGYVFQNVIYAGFQIAGAVMLCAGLMMLKGFKGCDFTDIGEFVPFIATVIGTVFMQNIAYGVAFGVIIHVIYKLLSFKLSEIKSITIPTAVMAILLIALLSMAIF